MSDSLTVLDVQGAIATVTLNRADKLNAVNDALTISLNDTLDRVNADDNVKIIIFKGAGRAFCAGADLTPEAVTNENVQLTEAQVRAETERVQDVTRKLVFSNKIVIGAIHGWAVGAGLEWTINCDFPIWAESAKGFSPEAQWGLSVTGAVTALLPALVGPIQARALMLLGEKHSARDFERLGIAYKVVPDADLEKEAFVLAEKLSALPLRALSDLKRAVSISSYHDLEKALNFETEMAVRAALDPQTLENIRKFSE